MRGLGPWLLLAVACLLGGRVLGLWPHALAGCAVGFLVGAFYVQLVLRRTASLAHLPVRQAVAAAQFAAVLRFGVVFVAFALVARALPGVSLGSAVVTFPVPLIAGVILRAREAG